MRYSATWEETAGVPIAVLRDHEASAEARIAPSLGNTCIAFRVGDWHVLDEPPNEAELLNRASSYGIPILFPWPNRVRDGRFTFEGSEYRLPPSTGSPHANHGLVRNRPWNTTWCEATNDRAVIESEILSTSFPELEEQYPSAFYLAVRHWLVKSTLAIDFRATNVGAGPLPFGFGLHPYFRVPLGPNGSRAQCELRVSADEVWELEQLLPTGRRLAVEGRLDLRAFRPLGDQTYDDVFTGLRGPGPATLRDPANGREIAVEAFERNFREFVVFAPEHRQIVALEPYSCVTDALNLVRSGIDTGLRILWPGQSWVGGVSIQVRER